MHRSVPTSNHETIKEFFKEIAVRGSIESIGLESTYNYYWLVDLLEDEGYNVRVGHPAAMQPYRGMKHQNDKSDAFFLADPQRVNNFPDCWICPREERPLRDLLRARLKLDIIRSFNKIIKSYEEIVIAELKKGDDFELIKSVHGIGDILAMTIQLETGDISRFKKAGNYTSYCRCVDSSRMSNGKIKVSGNTKNGSKYLKWAFTEAAQRCRNWCDPAKKYYQKKGARTNNTVATIATAAKLSKAVFYILRDKVPFDVNKCFK